MQPNLESIQGTYDRYHKAGFLKKALNVQDFYRADLREATP
jgi:NitT/TauT family transport system substrate-binding protein/sulfonate transport system substrate-binding protein